MPIGTSDGQHFEDEFHQEVAKASTTPASPYNPNYDTSSRYMQGEPSQNVEDRRFSDPIHRDNPSARLGVQNNYLQQDLSRQEKNPMSQEAGIGHIPVTNPQKVIFNRYFPDVLSAIEKDPSVWVDRSHEVPYIAGASKGQLDYVTHVDKSVPKSVTISGKKFDPAIPLAIHEQTEKEVMEFLINERKMPEEKAYQIAHHEYAQVAEDNWYRKQGIDVKEVDKFWKKINTKTEKDKGDFPPNLYTKPYPHDQVKGEKHTPSNVFQEGPVTQK